MTNQSLHDHFAPLPSAIVEQLRRIRHVALDMDGTIYSGHTRFPFTVPFLERLADLGVTHSFLTNNSSKSVTEYAFHLAGMNIAASAGQIYTSALATIEHLRTHQRTVRRLFIVGTASMTSEFAAAGFEIVADTPEAVVTGFDPNLNFEQLCRGAWFIQTGCPWVATHPDRVCPTDQPTVLIDCGSLTAALQAATGRFPDAVPGKPNPAMLQGLCRRLDIDPQELAMVGDRLYTDIEMARCTGALGVLVLSGETTEAMARKAVPPPDITLSHVQEFGELLAAARIS